MNETSTVSGRVDLREVAELYTEFASTLKRITRRRVHTSPETVEDACSTAWLTLVRCRPYRNSVRGWLIAVAQHEALRLDRADRRIEPLATGDCNTDEHPEPAAPADTIEHALELAEALAALASLPERKRQMYTLYALGFTYDEIGSAAGASHRTVDRQLTRARRRLRYTTGRE